MYLLSVSVVPKLSMSLTTTNTVVASWPSPSTDYKLEQTVTLSPSSWSSVTNTPADDGSVKRVTLPVEAGPGLFRLQKP